MGAKQVVQKKKTVVEKEIEDIRKIGWSCKKCGYLSSPRILTRNEEIAQIKINCSICGMPNYAESTSYQIPYNPSLAISNQTNRWLHGKYSECTDKSIVISNQTCDPKAVAIEQLNVLKKHLLNGLVSVSCKIVVFGCDEWHADWFRGLIYGTVSVGINMKIKTYKMNQININAFIYSGPSQERLLTGIKSSTSNAHGLILAYDMSNTRTLKGLKQHMGDIYKAIGKQTACLLLGIEGVRETKSSDSCVKDAEQFAKDWNIAHMQMNLKSDLFTEEPYKYILNKILDPNFPERKPNKLDQVIISKALIVLISIEQYFGDGNNKNKLSNLLGARMDTKHIIDLFVG
eukprot:179124_1